MPNGEQPGGLQLTEEEAYALLGLCLTSPQRLDAVSERAMRKLADHCSRSQIPSNHSCETLSFPSRELERAGA